MCVNMDTKLQNSAITKPKSYVYLIYKSRVILNKRSYEVLLI